MTTIDIKNAATDSPRHLGEPSPRRGSISLVRRIVATAAQHVARARAWLREFVAAVREFVRGEIPEAFIGERRGYWHPRCRFCGDVHDRGEICPNLWIGECDLCVATVPLDQFRNCARAGARWRFHTITRRRRYVPPHEQHEEVIHAIAR